MCNANPAGRWSTPFAWLVLFVPMHLKHAQAQTPGPKDQLPTTRIEGQANRSSASATGQAEVLRHEELTRFGQVSLGEALSRGGAVVLISGRNGTQELTLSGLGNGYTQILLNGSPAPRGFSLESLSADAIERVEIVRSASSEAGARGIAGTLNIVLKRASNTAAPATVIKAGALGGWMRGHMLDGSHSTSWRRSSLNVTASERNTTVERSAVSDRVVSDSGSSTHLREHVRGPARLRERSLAPRLAWSGGDRSLEVDALLQESRQHRFSDLRREDADSGAGGESGTNTARIRRDATSLSAAYRDRAFAEDLSFDTKLSVGRSKRVSAGLQRMMPTDADVIERTVNYPSLDRTLNGRAKLNWDSGQDTDVEVGLQIDSVRRSEEEDIVLAQRLHRAYELESRNTAAFVRWSGRLAGGDLRLGVRSEFLSLENGDVTEPTNPRSFRFYAPQLSWNGETSKGGPSVAITLGRAMRVPDENDFSSRTYYALFNSIATPDQQGNPGLRPETATSLEVAISSARNAPLEARGAITVKRLNHVITQQLFETNGAWTVRPANAGTGSLVLLDATLKRRQLVGQNYELRYGATSNVVLSRIALPDGRRTKIANAAPWQLSLNADAQARGDATWSGGFSLLWRAAFDYAEIGGAGIRQGERLQLDMYATRRLGSSTKLRISGSNLVQRNLTRTYERRDGVSAVADRTRTRDGAAFRLTLEWTV